MIQHELLENLRRKIRKKNDRISPKRMKWIEKHSYFYKEYLRTLKFIIDENAAVMHIRSGIGYILDRLKPALGVGIEDSAEQVNEAQKHYPHLTFFNQCVEDIEIEEKFDYILITSPEDIVDFKAVLDCIKANIYPHTRIITVNYNYLWHPLVKLAEVLNLRMPQKLHNWISESDMKNFLELCGYEIIVKRKIILFPFNIPAISYIINRFIARLPLIKHFCFLTVTIARLILADKNDYSVSVIIPCKNEVGNVEDAVIRIPEIGKHTEIIFCDDKSTDGTGDKVRELIRQYPEKDIKLLEGPGISKAENVWVGFDASQGDILMILDGDLTVIPEELPYFYEAIATRRGEYINGSRLVYPMHSDAMNFANIIGNKFFSVLFSYILDTKVKDTLCGTKVLWKSDYERIKKLRGSWGIRDRWGDYEIIFGAAKYHLKHIDLPVHYYERVYGITKMTNVLQNGLIMLRVSMSALFKIKFH
jgi:hypothetical protein